MKRGSNTIILDAYNANPASMEAALQNFSRMEGLNKVVFLGEMAELGSESSYEHRRITDLISNMNFQKVVLVGKNFSGRPDALKAEYFNSSAEAAGWAKAQNISDATILIKGSRSSRMELVLEGLG
jgi:UDP-N-acetylmuramoyl-tripeptide--D-alanyl-D-alanine ligase